MVVKRVWKECCDFLQEVLCARAEGLRLTALAGGGPAARKLRTHHDTKAVQSTGKLCGLEWA